MSFSLSRLYEFYLSIYLFYFPHLYSYSVKVLYFAGPPLSKTHFLANV